MLQLVEKYRPKCFEDLIGNQYIIDALKEMVIMKNIPHILFSGPPGVGKTCFQNVLIRELYKENYKRAYKEINASDQSGIEVVRTDIKEYARYCRSIEDIPFQILVLEECDEMSSKAQPALRRIMEQYAERCRFILTCNYEDNVIKPIKDRCKHYVVKAITSVEMIPRLEYICKEEGIQISIEALQYIAQNSSSMRDALNNYLETALLESNRHKDQIINLDFIKLIQINSTDSLNLLKNALNNKFIQTRQLALSQLKLGITARNLLKEIVDASYNFDKIPERMKGDIALLHAESELALVNGATDIVIISGFIAKLGIIGSKYLKKE